MSHSRFAAPVKNRRGILSGIVAAVLALTFGVVVYEGWRLSRLGEEPVMSLAIDTVDGRDLVARWRLAAAAQLGNVAAMRVYASVLLHGPAAQSPRGIAWLQRAAAHGDVQSLRILGAVYEGLEAGAPRPDPALARNYYRRAAEAGDRDAGWMLARLLRNGSGGPADLAEALRWTRIAAEAGQSDAMFALANLYASGGDGLQPDETQALLWYRRAAEKNQPEALQALGLAYTRGELGLPRDEQRGRELIAVSGEMSEHRYGDAHR